MLKTHSTGTPASPREPRHGGRRHARGVSLVEAMIAILILSVGLLGLVRMQSYSVTTSRDAMYRSEASVLAHEIIGIAWTDAANLAAYQHRAGGAICSPSGSAATSNNVSNWLAGFTTAGNVRYLPGATADKQQIIVDTSVTPPIVRVHLCWRSPQDSSDRSFVAVSRVPT